MISIPRLMCLIWVLSLFLEYAQSAPLYLAAELQDLEGRLRRQRLDRFGSPMMLCWLLLRKEESVELHPRSWAVVRHINVIKTWDMSKRQNLTTLLQSYLLGKKATETQRQQYHLVMKGVMQDMATLIGEMVP
jgi:hypothetical protein